MQNLFCMSAGKDSLPYNHEQKSSMGQSARINHLPGILFVTTEIVK
jgi:hypothetical protein